MLLRSHSERRALPGLTALLSPSFSKQWDTTPSPCLSYTPRISLYEPPTVSIPSLWVSQAISNLEKSEQELQSLRERQQTEVEEVNRELDNAMFEAQREERRLLAKIEQDHREAQRHFGQVKRENAAAVRVVQSLLDQQLRKIRQLKEQIQRWGNNTSESNKNQLQKGVGEATQPWEISLTMKRVVFVPTFSSETFGFGEVEVQEQSMTYPIGVCGYQGQKCALHSGDQALSNLTPLEIRKEPKLTRGGKKWSLSKTNKKDIGKVCDVHKLQPSDSTEDDGGLKTQMTLKVRHRGISESSQDEDDASMCSDTPGKDCFLPTQTVSSQGESDGHDSDGKQNKTKRRSTVKGKRRQKAVVLVSCEEPSCCLPESDDTSRDSSLSPKTMRKGSLSTCSLSKRHSSLSEQCALMKKCANESSVDSDSPPSPAESEDSCSTYTVDGPGRSRSVSTSDLSGKLHSLINGKGTESRKVRKVNRLRLTSEPSTFEQVTQHSSQSDKEMPDQNRGLSGSQGCFVKHMNRSQSLSAIGSNKLHHDKEQERPVDKSKTCSQMRSVGEGGEGSSALDSAFLVKQFGKQGSGRTDFNLPSGVYATARGQLFVVDCGNARIQVTDLNKNIVQQVSTSGSERSSRICNYFDVAVNSKGLIALTCAAERAVLVFNRHGRFLQTFGGTTAGSTNEELDAPRGVTVTRQDDFLIADIKRGTLTVLKLDPKTGARLERTVVTGYHRPYLVATSLATGLMVVSERGNESGRVPCVRVLEPGWNTIRILGVCAGMGPVLTCPWGLCIDDDGDVLVADWGKQQHSVFIFPVNGVGWPMVTDNLNSPRGLALLPDGHVVVSDSMNHCIKIYRYK